ncbi:DUF4942 domain-containing protein [Zhongshania marina]|uniref:DUF4942 domain-containing protein n=1 Tax=Zhongshania marina TaxID=2304603 RepID=A0A2S4HC62_9GAMM|nr:DUF4942 domain-containing protein [Marortus luteolus]POP51547.1 hypothetical protein C0068_16555 [Marortus luteolus]
MTATPATTRALVQQLKDYGQDEEWYPTTDAMLARIRSDMDALIIENDLPDRFSILDCGAGDGRTLEYLAKGEEENRDGSKSLVTRGKMYAIEKSRPLINALDPSIYIVGADFYEQTLCDKEIAVTFSNPPYSDYVRWTEKLLMETRSGLVYLILPRRWESDARIAQAIELRKAETTVIDSFDFSQAERKARAKVDIIRVEFRGKHRRWANDCKSATDPFELWFDTHFKIQAPASNEFDPDRPTPRGPTASDVNKELVSGSDMVAVLVKLYNRDMDKLISNYKALETMDPELLRELGVNFKDIRAGLYTKIKGCKQGYWQELFDRLQKITDRLTTDSREAMLHKLMSRIDVDFNASNAYAILGWALKNCNNYMDQQLIEVFERMVEKANVINYKSNKRTFGDEKWRYCNRPDDLSHFTLDYRVVLERVGGLSNSDFSYERTKHNGLSSRAHFFLLDILTIAGNIGFDVQGKERPSDFEWESNKKKVFHYRDHASGKDKVFAEVRCFFNGNMHVKFDQSFIQRLGIEHGRLKGWIKSAAEAAEEMAVSPEVASSSFLSNIQLGTSTLKLLGFTLAA